MSGKIAIGRDKVTLAERLKLHKGGVSLGFGILESAAKCNHPVRVFPAPWAHRLSLATCSMA